ncbi:MAG: hypothetical protein P0S94_00830 [Simkaniaceae bacterium]|nr:hypothetical protein [Simkaniaceae bacterium]
MKKKLASVMIAGAALCTPLSGELKEQDMQLINNKNGFIVAEFIEGECIIHDRFLKAALEKEGIDIPKSLRSEFDDKERIFITDALFEKAFRDVFYQLKISKADYDLVD